MFVGTSVWYVSINPDQITMANTTVNTQVGTWGISTPTIWANGYNLTSTRWNGAEYTVSTAAPSGGSDGNFWFQRDP